MRHSIPINLFLLAFIVLAGPVVCSQQQQTESRKIIHRAVPVYPELARKMHLEGNVRLGVTVAPNGTVKSVEVIGGNPLLAQAAEDAVGNYRWIRTNAESTEIIEMKFFLQ